MLGRRLVPGVDGVGRGGERPVEVAGLHLRLQERLGIDLPGAGAVEPGRGRLLLVLDPQGLRPGAGRLEGLGDDHRHDLPGELDPVRRQRCPPLGHVAAVREGLARLDGVADVLVGQDGEDRVAGQPTLVDLRHPSPGDRGRRQIGVGRVRHSLVVAVGRPAGHLEEAVDSRPVPADDAVRSDRVQGKTSCRPPSGVGGPGTITRRARAGGRGDRSHPAAPRRRAAFEQHMPKPGSAFVPRATRGPIGRACRTNLRGGPGQLPGGMISRPWRR